MRYKQIPSQLFIRNRQKLARKLKPNSLAIILSSDEYQRNGDQFHPYRQNSDMFYLSGLDQEKCILCLFPDHPREEMRELVFTVQTNDKMVTWYGHKYTLEQARNVSGVSNVKWLDSFEDMLKDLVLRAENIYLNVYENARFSADVPSNDLRFSRRLKEEYPLHNFERLHPLITECRLCKEPEEIDMIQQACDITEKAFRRMLDRLRPGMMEYEAEAEITHEFVRNGASGHAYAPIVASGINACVLHYIKNDIEIKDGDLVLFDIGAEYGNYAADLSRTIPANGKFTKRQKDCYNAVLRVQKQAKNLIVPGTTIEKINKAVTLLLEEEMINLGLFSRQDVQNQDPDNPLYFKYYMHGNSHFIGLDVHDVGTRQIELKPGMVLSCEPGIYIKEEGIGIRIENDILVSEKGPVDLMKNIPVEADDIERLMMK
ncbi:MAG TPA: aminopeptidase P N-terminal domain-containing protein [Bacteroidales bacterium]|nr:aminopeptidase P N-terminal domain-containing protein [Bacteroidales bacterium]HNZ41958.1 aminopeptidase P N-terminal domain-containing protein [Bacteroidales bacterium]HOH83854.1 aminopeptidase P N-terminal domain-containing protein [Bacteroidales bacterium]HPB24241.1 aminopeptidase P N-terminal domain-containing protein [Bacteroidales bacterium]HPI28936.1 aminopeptidase P N-terminal domain-containing protein [Bacteroidales bacterium]